MSEQVGASLVLAQIINPAAAAGPQSSSPPAAAQLFEGTVESAASATQPFEITEEISATFASLLTELATLEVQDAPPLADTLIRIRVETRPAPDLAWATPDGNNPPAGGNEDTEVGMMLPLPSTLQMLQPAPSADPLSHSAVVPHQSQEAVFAEAPIVVAEPRQANTVPSPPPENPAATDLSRPLAPPAIPAVPADRAGAEPAADSRLPGQTTNPSVQAINIDPDAAGQRQGEHSGRQPDPQAAARGTLPERATSGTASISFSHDAASAATAASGLLSAPAASGPAGVLAQTLPLLGQPSTWAEPLAERLAGIAARGMNTAEVRLHPPSLGQLEVRITLNNDQVSIWLGSPNADVREALQQALPRLDSLLNSLGIELADAEVSDQQPREFSDEAGRDDPPSETTGTTENNPGPIADSTRLGILDTWA